MNLSKLLFFSLAVVFFPLNGNAQGFSPAVFQFSTPVGPLGSRDTFQTTLYYPDTLHNLSFFVDSGIVLQETGQWDDFRERIAGIQYNLIVKVDSLMCLPPPGYGASASGSNFSAWVGVSGYVFDPHIIGRVHCDTNILNFGKVQVGSTSYQYVSFTLDTFGSALRYLFPLNIDSPFFSADSILTNSPCDNIDNSSFSFDPTEVKEYIDTMFIWDSLAKDSTMLILEGEGIAPDGVVDRGPEATRLSIFPNPSDRVCTVVLNNSQLDRMNFYTSLGDLVYSVQSLAGPSATVNTAMLNDGIYLVEVVSGDKTYRSRLTVGH